MYLSYTFLSTGDDLAMRAGGWGLVAGAILAGAGLLCLAVATRGRGARGSSEAPR